MWGLSQRVNTAWGIGGYEVPAQHFDHIDEARRKEYFSINTGGKKRPKLKKLDMTTKKETEFDVRAKRAQSVPPPWQYDVVNKRNEAKLKTTLTRNAQISRYKWQGVAKDDMHIDKPVKTKQKKPDTSLKKYTYIDKIVMKHTNKKYPNPGPGNYFMDSKTAKKYFKGNAELLTKKEETNKVKSKLP